MTSVVYIGVRDLTGSVIAEERPYKYGGFSDVYRGKLIERPHGGSLWRVVSRQTGAKTTEVAIKLMRVTQDMDPVETNQIEQDLMNEITTWSRLEHYNVLKLLGIARHVHKRELPSLVSPWCGRGSLFEVGTFAYRTIEGETKIEMLVQHIRKPLIASECISLILQAASAVSYLHSYSPPIIHGDLKSDNFLLRYNFQLLISDFGLSKIPREGIHSRFSRSTDGNVRWMSPELLFGGNSSTDSIPRRSLASDIWGLACTFYEILTSNIPYKEIHLDWNVPEPVRQGLVPSRPVGTPSEDLSHLQETMWPILQDCWAKDPSLRPNIDKVLYNLHHVILKDEYHHFYGPMFEFQSGKGSSFVQGPETRPSVIGDEEPDMLEARANFEPDENRVLAFLMKSAIGYHSRFDTNSACIIQFRIGRILLSRAQFLEARTYLELAKDFFQAERDYESVLECQQTIAKATQDLDERIKHYGFALALCRAQKWIDKEAFIVRALGNAIYEQSELANGKQKHQLLSHARLYLTEALSLYAGQGNNELQVQVRCELILLEKDADNGAAAQTHASAAFRCAWDTGNRRFAEEVCYYLESTKVLSEPMYNSFIFDLRIMTVDILETMLQSRVTAGIWGDSSYS